MAFPVPVAQSAMKPQSGTLPTAGTGNGCPGQGFEGVLAGHLCPRCRGVLRGAGGASSCCNQGIPPAPALLEPHSSPMLDPNAVPKPGRDEPWGCLAAEGGIPPRTRLSSLEMKLVVPHPRDGHPVPAASSSLLETPGFGWGCTVGT